MKIKLAIITGILIWIITSFLTGIFNPIFNSNLPQINIIVPIITIIVTGFFGIIYIRNIETNEVIEGILVGILYIIIDIILDMIFFVFPNTGKLIIGDYPIHIISITIITLSITTLLGYLAQMKIDLK
ncbi:MAG: hypothetical protein E7Z79_07355 [Methanobrevibacter thaueri]|uniref:Uncharacterized protein n=1 Tax=Methanobrevibacter thaueri TaxID=190975 RepID=A0A8T3VG51_9EURY|nr:hypothetical protein [Methanobrevibacter thaueri]MBE6502244.1 hypothetical protein [Methanobrevibacter thaueri]